MVRLFTAVVLTVFLVAFAMSNMHPVRLSLLVGPPVKVRLIFLMMSTFLLGMLFLGLMAMAFRLRVRHQSKLQAQVAQAQTQAQPQPAGDLLE
jgi:uncharacterized integral membrane protein